MTARDRQYADAEAAAQSALGAIRDDREEHVHGVGGDASEAAQLAAWRRARLAANRLVSALVNELASPTPSSGACDA
jgi:hypothetical protein